MEHKAGMVVEVHFRESVFPMHVWESLGGSKLWEVSL